MRNDDRIDEGRVGVLHASAGEGHIYSAPGGAGVYRKATGPDGTARLVASGEFDMDSSPCLQHALTDARADGATSIKLDVAAVAFGDSTFLHVLLRAHHELQQVVLIGPVPLHLRQLFNITGTAALYPNIT
ncbi:STAS domain-containing protein [Streptomyces sp. NPDC087908]|uniref:STAS domain-containing protein n=1 Tax=Streptomyces sp. NPDC087908 TaxID=3365820 RepID=UPI003825D205